MRKAWAHLHLPRLRAGVEDVISVKRPGSKIEYVSWIHLADVEFTVWEHGRQRCIRDNVRNVHAWVVGTIEPRLFIDVWPPEELQKAIYDPWKGNSFVNAETLKPVKKAGFALLVGKDVYYV